MAHISRDDVERVASLARLSLSEEEVARVRADLDRILEYVMLLGQLDTSDVEPTSHVMPLETPLREDRPEPPMDPELAVANAPEHDGYAFVVPKVIEDEDEG